MIFDLMRSGEYFLAQELPLLVILNNTCYIFALSTEGVSIAFDFVFAYINSISIC